MSDLGVRAGALLEGGRGLLVLDDWGRPPSARGRTPDERSLTDLVELVATTPQLATAVAGVVMPADAVSGSGPEPTAGLLRHAGMRLGVRGDLGPAPLPNFEDEDVTEGLDGLDERLTDATSRGAELAGWCSRLRVGRGRPSATCVRDNAQGLARFAASAQGAGVLPVIALEVSREGDHDVERTYDVLDSALKTVFGELAAHRVDLKGLLLRTTFVTPGRDCPTSAPPEHVAWATSRCLLDAVHATVPGVYLAVDELEDGVARAHLAAASALGPHPWPLSFASDGSVQAAAARAWSGSGREAARGVLTSWAQAQHVALHSSSSTPSAPTPSDPSPT